MSDSEIIFKYNFTRGELKIARKLLRSNKYRIYGNSFGKKINLIWGQIELLEGDKRLDFIIFSDKYLFVIEVKDHSEFNNHLFPWNETVPMSPWKQCSNYTNEIIELIKDNLQVIGIVMFTNLSCGEKLLREQIKQYSVLKFNIFTYFKEEINRDSMDTILTNTIHIYESLERNTISNYNMFCALLKINPTIFTSGELSCSSNLPLHILDLEQIQLAKNIALNGDRIVYGVAGSGKTIMLIAKAKQLADIYGINSKILVVCFNKPLKLFLSHKFSNYNIEVRTIQSWQNMMVHFWGRDRLINLIPDSMTDNYIKNTEILMEHGIKNGEILKKYDFILIDEGQDFLPQWFKQLKLSLNENDVSLFLVFLDSLQSISLRKINRFTWKEVLINAQGRTKYFRRNYRNAKTIVEVARDRISDISSEDKNSIDFVNQNLVMNNEMRKGGNYYFIEKSRKDLNYYLGGELIKIPKKLSIMIVYDCLYQYEKILNINDVLKKYNINRTIYLTKQSERLVTLTNIPVYSIHRCKGLEADVVFFIRSKREVIKNSYVGITRARETMYEIVII